MYHQPLISIAIFALLLTGSTLSQATLFTYTGDYIPKTTSDVITEAEIEENMGKGYRTGCCIAGGILAVAPASLAGIGLVFRVCGDIEIEECRYSDNEIFAVFALGFIVTELAVLTASYYVGESLDRYRANKRIKAQRRQQKEPAFGKQEMSGGFRLQLLTLSF